MAWTHRTPSRHLRGYGREWESLRRIVLARDAGLCQCSECKRLGRVRIASEVDHIKPKAKGGGDELTNLQSINTECHKDKTARDNGGQRRPEIGPDGWPVSR